MKSSNSHPHSVNSAKPHEPAPVESGRPKKANKTAQEMQRNRTEDKIWHDTLKKDALSNKPPQKK